MRRFVLTVAHPDTDILSTASVLNRAKTELLVFVTVMIIDYQPAQ